MKRIIFIATASLMMLTTATSASAHRKCDGEWKQKMMSEKIAFLTVELGITPEESQAFWPVYNEVSKDRDEAMHEVFKTYKAMEEGIKAGKTGKDAEKLLEDYLDALDRQRDIDSKAGDRYLKVLPVDKVAKLYIGEEKFRRQHIRRLHNGENKPGHKK